MKVLQKQGVAILLCIVAIAVAIGIGWWRRPANLNLLEPPQNTQSTALDTTLDTTQFSQFVYDKAGIFSDKDLKMLASYNANWDYRYNSVVAVVTVDGLDGNIEDYAWDQGIDMGLKEGDAVLAIDISGGYFVAPGEDFSSILTNQVVERLSAILDDSANVADPAGNILDFYSALNGVYIQNFGMGNAGVDDYNDGYNSNDYYGYESNGFFVIIILFLIIFVVVANSIDKARYRSYYDRYYGMPRPPVMFRPILFWHGPHGGWYRRRWNRPPPPPGGGFGGPGPGGPRPPSGGGSRHSSGFGGAGAGPRSGSGTFGGRPSGGGHSSGFGGTFGGGSSGSRGGSSGGFGGSRGSSGFGGSSGGSRGGSSGGFGGSRGGGFGGSRGGGGRSGGFGGRR